jgi:hypothetical protein
MVNAKFPQRDRQRGRVQSDKPLPSGIRLYQAKIYGQKFNRSLGGFSTN